MKWLKALGDIDGQLAGAAGAWVLFDPAHGKLAMGVFIVIVGIGGVLNGISRLTGGGDVVKIPPTPTPPPAPPTA